MRSYLALALICAMLLSLGSCLRRVDAGADTDSDRFSTESNSLSAPDSTNESEQESESMSKSYPKTEVLWSKTYSIYENADKIKPMGRTRMTATGLQCDFSATGLEFCATVQGTVTLELTVEGKELDSEKNDDAYFTVFIDGERSETRYKAPMGKTTKLTIANFKTQGTHTIQVLKQSEAKNGLCTMKSLTFSGTLNDAPAQAAHYIEFLGDSITCGYGNLCTNGTSPAGDTDYKDATQAFSFLTAKALGADHSLISCSGMGVTLGWRTVLAKQLFEKQSYYRSASTAYTVERTPDLVVINLGTNDEFKGADTTAFQADVGTLIQTVRTTYGQDTPIVWVYGMMGDGYQTQVLAAIEALGGESQGLYSVQLPENREGGGGHPTATAHKTAAEALASFIRTKNLLG